MEYSGNPSQTTCTSGEREYLCQVVNDYFKKIVSVADIVWDYSGVRPLIEDDASNARTVTRDYSFAVEDDKGQAPLIAVFGGKLTTYRRLAEHVMDRLAHYFPAARGRWTETSQLPGAQQADCCLADVQQRYPWLPRAIAERYVHSYGALTHQLLADMTCIDDLGIDFWCRPIPARGRLFDSP